MLSTESFEFSNVRKRVWFRSTMIIAVLNLGTNKHARPYTFSYQQYGERHYQFSRSHANIHIVDIHRWVKFPTAVWSTGRLTSCLLVPQSPTAENNTDSQCIAGATQLAAAAFLMFCVQSPIGDGLLPTSYTERLVGKNLACERRPLSPGQSWPYNFLRSKFSSHLWWIYLPATLFARDLVGEPLVFAVWGKQLELRIDLRAHFPSGQNNTITKYNIILYCKINSSMIQVEDWRDGEKKLSFKFKIEF